MSKTKTAKKTNVKPQELETPKVDDKQIAENNDKVTFVANNILNSITLNQAVTVIQQVALRDASTIVEEADEDKLKEIEDAMKQAIQSASEVGEKDTPAVEQTVMTDTIRMLIESNATTGVISTRIHINDHDTGMLYLNRDEYVLLSEALKGRGQNCVTHVDELVDDEVDLDIFDELDQLLITLIPHIIII